MVTSHDRAFPQPGRQPGVAIEPGEVVFHHGNYDSYVLARQKRMEQLEASAKRQERLIEKETKFINRFRSQATKASVVQSRIKTPGENPGDHHPAHDQEDPFRFSRTAAQRQGSDQPAPH